MQSWPLLVGALVGLFVVGAVALWTGNEANLCSCSWPWAGADAALLCGAAVGLVCGAARLPVTPQLSSAHPQTRNAFPSSDHVRANGNC